MKLDNWRKNGLSKKYNRVIRKKEVVGKKKNYSKEEKYNEVRRKKEERNL